MITPNTKVREPRVSVSYQHYYTLTVGVPILIAASNPNRKSLSVIANSVTTGNHLFLSLDQPPPPLTYVSAVVDDIIGGPVFSLGPYAPLYLTAPHAVYAMLGRLIGVGIPFNISVIEQTYV